MALHWIKWLEQKGSGVSKTGNEKAQDLSALKLGSSVAARQLKYSLFAAILLGLIITAFQIVSDYRWIGDVYRQANERVLESSVPVANEAVTKRDTDLAEAIVRGMMVQRSVSKVTITNEDGSVLYQRKRATGEIPVSRWAEQLFGGLQTREILLPGDTGPSSGSVAMMVVELNPQVFVTVFMSRSAWSFLANMVFAVAMAVVFAALSYFVFSRPLIKLAHYIVKSDPTDVKHPFEMPPMHRHDDEVQLLGSVTVGLFGMIRGQIGQLQRARDDLLDANVNLEARVESRTRELNDAMGKLEVLASTDPLTGLANRRVFMTRLEENLSIWKRRGTPMSILLLDIDKFKLLNDTYGHQAGDAVLASLSKLLQRSLRDIDLPARLGGEEFAVLLPGEEKEGAMILAERLRASLEQDAVAFGGKHLNYTSSFGVISLPTQAAIAKMDAEIARDVALLKSRENSDLADILYSLADEALYRAKETGRNRCTFADLSHLSVQVKS